MEISEPRILGDTDLRKIWTELTFDGTIRRVNYTMVPIPNPTIHRYINSTCYYDKSRTCWQRNSTELFIFQFTIGAYHSRVHNRTPQMMNDDKFNSLENKDTSADKRLKFNTSGL